MTYAIDIEQNPDRYSEFPFYWTISDGSKIIEYGLAVSEEDAQAEAEEALSKIKKVKP